VIFVNSGLRDRVPLSYFLVQSTRQFNNFQKVHSISVVLLYQILHRIGYQKAAFDTRHSTG